MRECITSRSFATSGQGFNNVTKDYNGIMSEKIKRGRKQGFEKIGSRLLKTQQGLEERGQLWVDEHGRKFLEKIFRGEKLKARDRNFTGKLKKGIRRVKDELARETKGNKEMFETYYLYIRGETTSEEMDKANEQFRNLLKTIGMGALIVVPFSPVTIPAFIRIGNALGIDILPAWFKKRKEP